MSDTKLVHEGRLIHVFEEKVDHANGESSRFDIVRHPGGAVIAAFDEKRNLCLIRQWRHAVQRHIWEFPAGCIDDKEPPLQTAQRELKEETGFSAERWLAHGNILVTPGYSDEQLFFFSAYELTAGKQQLEPAEELEVHWFNPDQVGQMIEDGKIIDAKTLAFLAIIRQPTSAV